MPAPRTQPAAPGASPCHAGWLAAALVLIVVLAYANTLHAPFVFDDLGGVIRNDTIRDLRALGTVLQPPAEGSGVTGRPLVNASLALNYAMGGLAVESYHVTNALIHVLASLALFGVVRRTLRRDAFGPSVQRSADVLAGAIALLWAVHPVQTESVTCVIQRTESLVGAIYLAAVYAFIRSMESPHWGWRAATVVACAAGMATKEVMVSAPLILFLYDRTFVAGAFAGAWRARRGYYVALAATWLLLAALVLGQGGSRGNAEGGPVFPIVVAYAGTQATAILRYVGLSVWPHPLVLDYGRDLVTRAQDCLLPAFVIVLLLSRTVVALREKPVRGFVFAWFFVILAPSSSVIPLLPQPVAEHRLYLPLAALCASAVLGVHRLVGRRLALPVVLVVVAALALTIHRNAQYRSVTTIWRDTLTKVPGNARAYYNLACEIGASDYAATARACEAAVAIDSGYADGHNNLGQALGQLGRSREALFHLRLAVRINPDLTEAWGNLGIELLKAGLAAQALGPLQHTVLKRPQDAEAHGWLGNGLLTLGRIAEAEAEYLRALQLRPAYPEVETNLAVALLKEGRVDSAIEHLQRAVQLSPNSPNAQNYLALAVQLRAAKSPTPSP